MKNLPNDWYESSMRALREEAKTWPEWMQNGVEDAREQAERRMAKYRLSAESDDSNDDRR
jgi:hypothetical protein